MRIRLSFIILTLAYAASQSPAWAGDADVKEYLSANSDTRIEVYMDGEIACFDNNERPFVGPECAQMLAQLRKERADRAAAEAKEKADSEAAEEQAEHDRFMKKLRDLLIDLMIFVVPSMALAWVLVKVYKKGVLSLIGKKLGSIGNFCIKKIAAIHKILFNAMSSFGKIIVEMIFAVSPSNPGVSGQHQQNTETDLGQQKADSDLTTSPKTIFEKMASSKWGVLIQQNKFKTTVICILLAMFFMIMYSLNRLEKSRADEAESARYEASSLSRSQCQNAYDSCMANCSGYSDKSGWSGSPRLNCQGGCFSIKDRC